MKNDNINELFKELDFDNKEPATGHKKRFLEKLEEQNNHSRNSVKVSNKEVYGRQCFRWLRYLL